MEKIYIAGAGGMLGEAFYEKFKKDYIIKCTDKDVNENWLSYLDFRNTEKYYEDVLNFKPEYLFHLGAHTNLEYCENNINDAYLTNSIAVESAVIIANKLNIPLLYISTAGIFDGKKKLYDDWDNPNPLGVYARTKYLGERYVIENCNKYFVCRAGWMMGSGPIKDKKFIQKIMSQIKNGATILNIVDDKDGTPTYTHDFAETVKELIKTDYYGLYNMVCDGQTSRLEVAEELINIIGLGEKIKVAPVKSDYFAKEFFAPRPDCERLVNSKLNLRGINKMRNWKISLKEYLDNYYSDYL
jgi:dTDP-4-dehydrorhamnose reductase